MYHQQHMVPVYSQKQNFASCPKHILTTQTARTSKLRMFSTRPVSEALRGQDRRGRGVNWFTWHKPIVLSRVSCGKGSTLKPAQRVTRVQSVPVTSYKFLFSELLGECCAGERSFLYFLIPAAVVTLFNRT